MLYDRWIISSWGRAGTIILGQQLFYELEQANSSIAKFIHVGMEESPIDPNQMDVIHSHSIPQINHTDKAGLVYAVREPTSSSISAYIAENIKSLHIHTESAMETKRRQLLDPKFKHKWALFESQLKENSNWKEAEPLMVDMNSLTGYRNRCVAWNNKAAEVTKSLGRKYYVLNYADWHGDLKKSAAILDIPYREIKFWTLPNIKPLTDQIANYDEVMKWKESYLKEDLSLIQTWITK